MSSILATPLLFLSIVTIPLSFRMSSPTVLTSPTTLHTTTSTIMRIVDAGTVVGIDDERPMRLQNGVNGAVGTPVCTAIGIQFLMTADHMVIMVTVGPSPSLWSSQCLKRPIQVAPQLTILIPPLRGTTTRRSIPEDGDTIPSRAEPRAEVCSTVLHTNITGSRTDASPHVAIRVPVPPVDALRLGYGTLSMSFALFYVTFSLQCLSGRLPDDANPLGIVVTVGVDHE